MKFEIACGVPLRHADPTVIEYVKRDSVTRWPSVEEVVKATGIPAVKVRQTLSILIDQDQMCRVRRAILKKWDEEE